MGALREVVAYLCLALNLVPPSIDATFYWKSVFTMCVCQILLCNTKLVCFNSVRSQRNSNLPNLLNVSERGKWEHCICVFYIKGVLLQIVYNNIFINQINALFTTRFPFEIVYVCVTYACSWFILALRSWTQTSQSQIGWLSYKSTCNQQHKQTYP